MPKAKYRAPVDKKHKERLDAFSFGGAIDVLRRRSGVSQYSPMGSRMPSRRGSRVGGGGEGVGGSGVGGAMEGVGEGGDVGNGEFFLMVFLVFFLVGWWWWWWEV